MKQKTIQEKEKEAYNKLKSEFSYKNVMQAPRLTKVVVSSGTGSQIKKTRNATTLSWSVW